MRYRSMKLFYTLIFSLFVSYSFSQTKAIAHKSHSGDMANFSIIDYDDNLGLPSAHLVEVIKLNDSTAVLVKSRDFKDRYLETDTIISNPIEPYVKSLLKYEDLNQIKLVGFDSLKAALTPSAEKNKRNSIHIIPIKNNSNSGQMMLYLSIISLVFLMILFTWRKYEQNIYIS